MIKKIYTNTNAASENKRSVLNNKGFTLFVALIVTSLLLAIGFSLSNIILKQLVFAQSSRESQVSFYAADSGAECAMYWDTKDEFGSTTPYGAFATSTQVASSSRYELYCGYGDATDAKIGSFTKILENGGVGNVTAATTTFSINFHNNVLDGTSLASKDSCARVQVQKWITYVNSGTTTVPVEHTIIEARGYNIPFAGTVGMGVLVGNTPGDGDCQISGNRVVERAVRVEY